jgi:hypothetical protein
MYVPGFNVTQVQLKTAANISSATSIRSYAGLTSQGWTYVHDKDLDSNIYYTMPASGGFPLRRIVLDKGVTTFTQSTIYTYTGTNQALGLSYIPSCMWSTASYGAFMLGGYQQSNIHILEFSPNKLGIRATWTVPYKNEVYGVEVIPALASGFTYNFGVAYTRVGKEMASWTTDMDAKTWANRKDNTYSSGITGPANGNQIIYYPPGKPIFTNDPDTANNRIGMTDTSTSNVYVWTITQSTVALNWTFLKLVPMPNNGGYPYHLSQAAYNAIS